ncbi:MAG: HIRAN domain-containing protein [Euzebya sp.]
MGVPPLPLMRLGAGGRVNAVGESHYQDALSQICHGEERRGDVALHQSILIPEPDNLHDANAVRVAVDGLTVGYLAREDAGAYQPLLLQLRTSGHLGWCPAAIVGGGERWYGVFLRLAEPDAVWPANSPGRLRILEADRNVAVTKRKAHNGVLEGLLSGHESVLVYATLEPSTIASGKYVGQPCLEVQVDGRRIGEFSSAMTSRYASHVNRGCGCEVVINRTPNGIQAQALMPIATSSR